MGEQLDWWTASARVGELSGQIAQLHARLVDVTAQVIADEAWRGDGIRSVEHFLEIKTGLDRGTVSKLVRVARRVGELPETVALLTQGRVSLDQAAVVAKHAPVSHSVDVAEFAEHATVSQLRKALAGWFRDTTRQDVDPETMRPDELQVSRFDDRFQLRFTTQDMVTADLVEQALREAKDALFKAGDTQATLADGLVEVAHRSLAAVGSGSRRDRFRVLVHLDTAGQSWLHRRGVLPQHVVDRFTCDGDLVPVWETEGRPVNVGRTKRVVPKRVRILVEDRDKGCRFPGCHSISYLDVHHQVHWRDGGITEPANLLCLCGFHHRAHHHGEFTIEGDPEQPDGLTFLNQWGRQIDEDRPEPTPVPALVSAWNGPSGEPLQTRWLNFATNPGFDPDTWQPIGGTDEPDPDGLDPSGFDPGGFDPGGLDRGGGCGASRRRNPRYADDTDWASGASAGFDSEFTSRYS